MTPESQRIALAKWARWQSVRPFNNGTEIKPVGFAPDDPFPHDKGEQFVPDYLHDLNAVHELECRLTVSQIPDWVEALQGVTGRMGEYGPGDRAFWFAHATAAQRCEALLRTLGLWED